MKIPKYVTVEKEIEVEVHADDFCVCLKESQNPVCDFMQAANDVAIVLKGCPDSVIERLSESQRKVIGDFLADQSRRFAVTKEAAAKI